MVPVVDILSMVALDSIYVLLRPTIYQSDTPLVPGINVDNPSGPGPSSPPYYVTFYHPDGTRCDYPAGTGCPTPHRKTAPSRPTPGRTRSTPAYDFKILDAGATAPVNHGDVTVDAADPSPSATRINIIGYVDIYGNGDIHSHTNGFIIYTEKPRTGGPNRGDLRVAEIKSFDDDVTLFSPGAILDSDNDKEADVIGRNISMTAGNNLHGDTGSISGHGGVGTPRNFLEIIVNGVGGSLGVLTVTDTASERTGWNIDALPPFEPGATNGTYGMFLTQTTGDMPINRGLTNGDASLVASNGSILDGRNGGTGVNLPAGLANIEANNVDLAAYCSASSPSASAAASALGRHPAPRTRSGTT